MVNLVWINFFKTPEINERWLITIWGHLFRKRAESYEEQGVLGPFACLSPIPPSPAQGGLENQHTHSWYPGIKTDVVLSASFPEIHCNLTCPMVLWKTQVERCIFICQGAEISQGHPWGHLQEACTHRCLMSLPHEVMDKSWSKQ